LSLDAETIERAVSVLRSGGVVGVPTDTVYGLAVDPLDEEAMSRLFEIKGRPDHKPVGILVASIEQAEMGGEIEGPARALAEEHWPGALTLVVTPKVILADWAGERQRKTVGLRVPDHPITLALLEAFGPLAVTSANRSGGPETMTDVEARDVFGDEVDLYLEGVSPGGEASTVVDATGAELTVLRQGPVTI
jgi:tRNA threonylcarbamoyl adenosine modification protein (Sua5/YciO/YrdC/YwlC family)